MRRAVTKAQLKARLRRRWLIIHRWLGLAAGLLFVLVGLTGSLLVFDHAIDEWLNAELLLTTGSGDRRTVAEVLAAGENGYSQGPATAAAVSSPRVANGVWTVWFQSGADAAPTFTAVYVDPYTAAVTGERVWGEDLMSTVYRLHYTLLAGSVGQTIVGVSGLLLLISVVSGLYLWWPLWKAGWRPALAFRFGKRCIFDLHKLLGLAAAPLLAVIAFTGVYMTFPNWFTPVLQLVSQLSAPPEGLQAAVEAQRISPDQAIDVARSHFPNASFCHLHPPQQPDGVYEVAVLQPGEVQRSFGRTQLWIDPSDGRVLAMRNPHTFTVADRFIAWQFPLHNGEAFGLPGRLAVCGAGIAPAVLYVTGLVLWVRRQRGLTSRQLSRSANLNKRQLPLTDSELEADKSNVVSAQSTAGRLPDSRLRKLIRQ
jgi:uncharacterized iron-regulated membrane protein